MPFTLPDLPYSRDALEPHMSAKTLEFHHGKHHNAYVTKLNGLIEGTDLAKADLETIISKTAKDESKSGIFNNAAQVWNHTFFWNCMKPGGGGEPGETLKTLLSVDFGGYDTFLEEFKQKAGTLFGSGWAWLVLDGRKPKIFQGKNADTPIAHGWKPLLTVDVWEHAYYLDYQNRRPDFVSTFFEKLVNWDFVEQQLR